MRFYPGNEVNVSFDYTDPWDDKPWFISQRKPIGRKWAMQEFPTIYEHYRILDFTRFNPPPLAPAGGKKKSKKQPKPPPGWPITMLPFKQLPPYEVFVNRINPCAELLFCGGGQWIKLTRPDPFGMKKVAMPLSLQDLKIE